MERMTAMTSAPSRAAAWAQQQTPCQRNSANKAWIFATIFLVPLHFKYKVHRPLVHQVQRRPSGRAGCICTHENPECLGSQLGFTPTAGMMRPLLRYRGIPPRPCRPGEPGYLPIARLADTWCLAQL